MNALEEALLLLGDLNPNVQPQLDARILKAKNYLQDHYKRQVKLPELAGVCGLSVSRLAHLFQEQVGVSPMMFLEKERFEQAKKLLMFTAKTVAEVSEEVGFADPFYFTRRFKLHAGVGTRDFRTQGTQRERL